MATGNWALLHEYAIYQYMMQRFQESRLKLHPVILNGEFYTRTKYYFEVTQLDTITDTKFPDIKGICIKNINNSKKIPAEIKYRSSLFDYHTSKKYKDKYNEFKKEEGCLIVYKHDILPPRLFLDYKINIFELNQKDFVIFIKENFDRLFFEQVQDQTHSNIWMFYQGRETNFNKGYDDIPPARELGLWCPKKIISPFQLSIGDKALFIKTGGIGQKELGIFYNQQKKIHPLWYLDEIYIAKIVSPILTREEFCLKNKKYNYNDPIWGEEKRLNRIKYNYVFQFKEEKVFSNLGISLSDLNLKNSNFVNKLFNLFIRQREIKILKDEYVLVIENILEYQNKNFIKNITI